MHDGEPRSLRVRSNASVIAALINFNSFISFDERSTREPEHEQNQTEDAFNGTHESPQFRKQNKKTRKVTLQ